MSVHMRPEEIEAESFRLIEAEVGPHPWSPEEWQVVRRVIHTSADFEYSRSLFFSAAAVVRGIQALRAGHGIITDTNMALAGISKQRLRKFGNNVSCLVADPQVAREAEAEGITRSIVAMRTAAIDSRNRIFVIGNAPTSLFELLRLVRAGAVNPELIVALPVGFVGAAESKEALLSMEDDFPGLAFITNRGRKGGSNVAAAVINSLLIMADEG
jgi:precorrin-8X/cobalt-precorrin-8 methylmutase